MNKMKYLLVTCLAGISPWAAAELSYTNVGVGYVLDGEFDLVNVDLDGFAISGSVAVADSFYVLGEYQSLETDPGNADLDRINVGVGFHTPVGSYVDFDGSFSYSDIDVVNVDGNGFQLQAGLRGMPTGEFEWGAYLIYEDLDLDNLGGDSDTGYSFGGRYFFANNASVGANLRDVSDVQTLTIGLRFDF